MTVADPAGDSTPQLLAAAVGEAGVQLGIRGRAADIAGDFLGLAREPMEQFRRYPNWPSAMNRSGLPVELSVRLDGPGAVALRCVVEVTDHRLGPEGNLRGYADAGASVAGCTTVEQADVVADLCRAHLDGIPPRVPSRLVHGLGFAAPDRRRGSLYFRTGWLAGDELARRLPGEVRLAAELRRRYGCAIPAHIEVMGYDFERGSLRRRKMYTWLGVRTGAPFAAVGGTHPDLEPAGDLYARFAPAVPGPAREHALFLQSSADGGLRQRLFFFADAWGWTSADGLRDLFGVLATRHGVDLGPLVRFRRVLHCHRVRLRLSMVAVGGVPGGTSVTFYFLPASGDGDGATDPGHLRDRAVAYLAAWRGVAGDPVAAYVAAVLGDGSPRDVATDAETAALGVRALVRGGRPLPRDWAETLLRHGADTAESAAAVLLAIVEGGGTPPAPAIGALVGMQRADGGWPASRWGHDLRGTGWALRGLAGIPLAHLDPGLAARVAAARRLGAEYVRDVVVTRDPGQLGLWLTAWLAGGGPVHHATVGRVVAALAAAQRADGGWAGDDGGPLTTATVVEALDALPATPRNR